MKIRSALLLLEACMALCPYMLAVKSRLFYLIGRLVSIEIDRSRFSVFRVGIVPICGKRFIRHLINERALHQGCKRGRKICTADRNTARGNVSVVVYIVLIVCERG